jgi:hypothetical protein
MRRKFNGAKQYTEDTGHAACMVFISSVEEVFINLLISLINTNSGSMSVEERFVCSEAKVETDVERTEVRMLA